MENTAIIWSKDGCPNCVTAKQLMTEAGIRFEEKKIDYNATREEFFENNPGCRSVPQIHLNNSRFDHNSLTNFIGELRAI